MKIVSLDFQKLVTPSDLLCRHFFFYYWCIQSSCYGLLICCFIIHSIFSFFSWTIHVSMHSAQEWHNLVCLPSGNCISSCASHYMKILRWSLCSHPYLFLNSSAPATFSPFFSSLSQSFHSFKTVSIQSPHHLRPITLWFLCSHTVIHPHSAPSCPFTNHSDTLLPWVSPMTSGMKSLLSHQSYSFRQHLLTPPLPFHLICHPASLHVPLSTLVDIRSCTRKLLTCGGIDDFWYQ